MSENSQNISNGTSITTRMAPSPTGKFHVGSARTALFSYLFGKHHGGKFVLRIEDTDKERSKPEFEANIIESFEWLGLKYDEFYRQSERTEIYKEQLQKLIDSGAAYISSAEEEEAIAEKNKLPNVKAATEGKRSSVIRFKNPNTKIKFQDIILGEIEIDSTDLGDFVIAKDLETPLYHLTVVVDDGLMGISHVIRAQEHLANTPRQILILEALGFARPIYAHIPLVLAPDKTKLSKRHGATALLDFRDMGYLPEAVLNFLAFLGWNPGTEQEMFSLDELIKEFSLEKVQKSGGVFNMDKLNWFNKEYIKKMPEDLLISEIKKFLDWDEAMILRAKDALIERINKFSDLQDENEFGFYKNLPDYAADSLIWKKLKEDSEAKQKTKDYLFEIKIRLMNISDNDWNIHTINSQIMTLAQHSKGEYLWPMRFALSGKDKSPDPITLAYIFGKEETIKRIGLAIDKIKRY
jgi:glutamyl-tRNA synthetase